MPGGARRGYPARALPPDLASGAAAAASAGAIQTQLSYSRLRARSRSHRLPGARGRGLRRARHGQLLREDAARHARGRRRHGARLPAYTPVTTERIADAQNRAASLPYKQQLDSPEFQIVRAKLRAEGRSARRARVLPERGARSAMPRNRPRATGLRRRCACAARRSRRRAGAGARGRRIRGRWSSARGTCEARARRHARRRLAARRSARAIHVRPLLYAHAEALQEAGRNADASAAHEIACACTRDPRLYQLQAKNYAALGKRLLKHQSQAEVYALQGSLPAAIEQLQVARRGRRRLLSALGRWMRLKEPRAARRSCGPTKAPAPALGGW